MMFTRMGRGIGIDGMVGSAVRTVAGAATATAVVLTAPVSVPALAVGGAVAIGTIARTGASVVADAVRLSKVR